VIGEIPPYFVFSKNASDKNFEIAICSKIVQTSYNKVFGVDRIPQNLRVRVASYAPGPDRVFMKGVVV
jgi:tRNA splicing ligase